MSSSLTVKVASEVVKRAAQMGKIDMPNPLTLDGVQFGLEIGKTIVKVAKDIIF